MTISLEIGGKVLLGSQAWLLEEDRELAWAEKYVTKNRAYKYVLGNFVEANKANDNGHIFPLADLEASKDTVRHSPMNILHRPHYIVGSFIAQEMVYPIGGVASASALDAKASIDNPYLETLGVLWSYYFPEETRAIEAAHKEGRLFFSMEALPESLHCTVCDGSYAYDGPQSPTYCADLRKPAARRELIKPHFTGGALVLPPSRPAWKQADVNELTALMAEYADAAETTYNEIAKEFSHLESTDWEAMMQQVLLQATFDGVAELARSIPQAKRKQLAKEGKALPDGSYPIETPEDLANAIRLAQSGHGNVSAAKSLIIRRAKALGKVGMLPDGWGGS